jgi:hypothetical protein
VKYANINIFKLLVDAGEGRADVISADTALFKIGTGGGREG